MSTLAATLETFVPVGPPIGPEWRPRFRAKSFRLRFGGQHRANKLFSTRKALDRAKNADKMYAAVAT